MRLAKTRLWFLGHPQGYVLEVGFIIVSLRLLKNVSLYYFLICKKCNIYQECCDDSLKDRILKTAVHNNFVVSNTTLEIEGHCLDCSQK